MLRRPENPAGVHLLPRTWNACGERVVERNLGACGKQEGGIGPGVDDAWERESARSDGTVENGHDDGMVVTVPGFCPSSMDPLERLLLMQRVLKPVLC